MNNTMFKKLRIRLTLLCCGVTTLVLAVLSMICLWVFENDVRSQDEASFQSNLTALCQTLQQTTISHSALRQMEYQYQFLLRMFDNGSPLLFQSLSESESSSHLLDLTQKTAAEDYSINVLTAAAPKSTIYHREFVLPDCHPQIAASVALIPRNGKTLAVLICHSSESVLHRIALSRIIFLISDLAALGLLTVFFWLFIGHMLRPLQENQQKQIQFVASASHELRSPLSVILSHVDAVRQGGMAADEPFLSTISSESTRMSHLISDMLQLASADNYSWNFQPSETEIDTLLMDVWETFEPMAKSKHLSWKLLLPEETVPHCLCDAERIRQLLSILIDNAFSYTPPGGEVILSLKASRKLMVTVSDDGPGIPDSQKKLVFERFYCADPSHKKKAHYGLGLSIAREIVKLHKGKLLLTDTPGGGATFTIQLPYKS